MSAFNTETVIETVTVDRVGTLQIVQTVDFAALVEASTDGKISIDDLTAGGTWGVKLTPNGKGKEPVTFPVEDEDFAKVFLSGFLACVDARKKTAGGSNGAGTTVAPEISSEEDLMQCSRKELRALCGKFEVAYKANDGKPALQDLLRPTLIA